MFVKIVKVLSTIALTQIFVGIEFSIIGEVVKDINSVLIWKNLVSGLFDILLGSGVALAIFIIYICIVKEIWEKKDV